MALGLAIIDTLRAQWTQALADYDSARRQLDEAESQLYASYDLASQDEDDLAEWRAQFDRVNGIKSAMDALANTASAVSGWWQSFTGAFGLSGAKRKGIAGTLGAGPLAIPAAVLAVGAFTATIGRAVLIAAAAIAFVKYLFAKQVTMADVGKRANELVDQGMSPDKASQTARDEAKEAAAQSVGHIFITALNKALWIAVVIVGGIFVLPKLLEKR